MRLVKVFVPALVALLISSMGLAAALVLMQAPPATGPGADRYTTAVSLLPNQFR